MKTAAVLFLMSFGLVMGAACGDNAKASEACKAVNTDGEACNTCRKANGASGYKFVTGSPCGCLGGG